MSSTLSELVQRTVTRLSMVAGVGVQVYAEDRIAEMIQHKFIITRDMMWWSDMMDTVTLTCAANGDMEENVVRDMPALPVGDEIVINSYNDIQYVWRVGNSLPLKELPGRTPKSVWNRPGQPMYRRPSKLSVIGVAPYTVGQQIEVKYKMHYGTFMPNDVVPMDDQLMILGACYDYLEDDGTNAGQTEKFRNLFNDRLDQLMGDENERELTLSPYAGGAGNWQVV